MKRLPKSISPNPLVITSVELRFNSELDSNSILSKVFPVFNKDFPNLQSNNIPPEIRNTDPSLKFVIDFKMHNDVYSIAFSPRSLLFEHISNDYTLWKNYYAFITENLSKFLSLNIINEVTRVGVRYVSILEKFPLTTAVFENLPTFNLGDYSNEKLLSVRTQFSKGKHNITLQVAPEARAEKNAVVKSGILIDIDAETTQNLIFDSLPFIIDELHTEEKILFFNLLTQEYIDKYLNPIY